MDAQGIVVLPGQGQVSSMTPGRSVALKLLGGVTGDSIMMFEETVPAGTKSTFRLHHDSDHLNLLCNWTWAGTLLVDSLPVRLFFSKENLASRNVSL